MQTLRVAPAGAIVKEGAAFNTKEIEAAAQEQGVQIRRGDVVLSIPAGPAR